MRQMALAARRQDRHAARTNTKAADAAELLVPESDGIAAADAAMTAQFHFALLDMEPLPSDDGVGFFLDRFQHEQGVEVDLDAIPGDALGTVVTLLELERLWTVRKGGRQH